MDDADNNAEYVARFQEIIDSGLAWRLEGAVGREAMRLIDARLCSLGPVPTRDYYGFRVPSRYEIEPGYPGSPLDDEEVN